jgi:hypothetical protein
LSISICSRKDICVGYTDIEFGLSDTMQRYPLLCWSLRPSSNLRGQFTPPHGAWSFRALVVLVAAMRSNAVDTGNRYHLCECRNDDYPNVNVWRDVESVGLEVILGVG